MKLLIVDDEPMIREWFGMTVERLGDPYTIVGEAANGEEALEFCAAHEVDLVVTDVKMPGMDGLELLRHLKERYPQLRVVIFSSHDEFQFATQALKLGAREYVLKAEITLHELGEMLQKIKRDLDMEQGKLNEMDKLRFFLNQHELALRTAYFRDLLLGTPGSAEQFQEKIRLFKTNLTERNLTLIAVGLIQGSAEHRPPAIPDPGLLELAVTNIINETVHNELASGCSLLYRDEVYVVLLNAEASGMKSRREKLLLTATRIAENLQRFVKVETAIAISTTYSGLQYLGEQLKEACDALDSRLFYGQSGIVIPSTDVYPPRSDTETGPVYRLRDEFCQQLEAGRLQEAQDKLLQLLQVIGEARRMAPKQTKAVILDLIYKTIAEARKQSVPPELLDSVYGDAHWHIQQIHYHRLIPWTEQAITRIFDEIAQHRRKYGEAVRKACGYVEQHFGEEILLQHIAEHVHLSRTYFSELFKKETGVTFNEYVTGVRMEKAKMLLKEQPLKVSEAAERVGYGNTSHFIKLFKKHTGFSPMEYMASHHGTRPR
ncbi:response regulator transcription factor [Paenibacillus sp. 1P07SE]|uniref:response regulator transcription factor n=1 Tax=Paenibacillus sp. 1P07SE TaxID=3132209 RepID=UPI0039A5CA71